MILLLIILYILNVFLNRWLNKILYQCNKQEWNIDKPKWWLIPIFYAIIAICLIINEKYLIKSDWFTGKHWIIIPILFLTSCATHTTTKYTIIDSNNHKYYTNSIHTWNNCTTFDEYNRNGTLKRHTILCDKHKIITNN